MARQYTNNIIKEATPMFSGIITAGSLNTLFDGDQDAKDNYVTLKKDPNRTDNIVIGFQFPKTKLIGRITINSRKDYTYIGKDPITGVEREYTIAYGDESVRRFNLFGSNNATTTQNGTWKNILSTFAGRSNGNKQTFEIANPEEFNFYKLEVIDNYGAVNDAQEHVVSMVELEAFEMIVPMRYVVKDGVNIRSYDYAALEWVTLGKEPVTMEMFDVSNMTSLAGIPWHEVVDKDPKIYAATYYLDETYEAEMIAIPPSQLVLPTDDISITSVLGINEVKFEGEELNGGMLRIFVSVDEGVTWNTWDASQKWIPIDIMNKTEVRGLGLSLTSIHTLSRKAWDALTVGKETIRFGFYLDQFIYTDKAEVVSFTMNVELKEAWAMAIPGVDYSYRYLNGVDVSVALLTDGHYKINY